MTTQVKVAVAGAAAAGAAAAAGKLVADRRNGSEHGDGPPRRYRLRAKENPAAGIRRIVAGRAASAQDELNHPDDLAKAVHEARKDLKKARSALRLVRPRLPEEIYSRENDRFRRVGRSLGAARDAEVKLQTLETLRSRYEDEFPTEACKPLIEELERERDELASGLEENGTGDAAVQLHAGRAMAAELPLDADGWDLVEPGLKRSYRRGRRRLADVRRSADPEAVHEWRKRVKDLWYHQRVLVKAWPDVIGETADQTHELADLLGDHHDLSVLADDLRGREGRMPAAARKALQSLIDRRQDELLEQALRLGDRVYAEKPKRFVKRYAAYWHAWRPDSVHAAA